jgi:hypothetical protein
MLFSNTAIATDGTGLYGESYFNIGISNLRYDEDPILTHHSALTFRIGTEVTDHIAVEGHATIGLEEDKFEYIVEFEQEIDYLIGMYFRGHISLWDPQARAYARVGFTRGKFTTSYQGVSSSDSKTDLGYGLGLELFGNKRHGINLEAMRYLDVDDEYNFHVDSVTVGYLYRF